MFSGSQTFATNQRLAETEFSAPTIPETTKQLFKYFIHDFQRQDVRPYQIQVTVNSNLSKHYIIVNLSDIKSYDEQLFENFIQEPLEGLKHMEMGLQEYVERMGAETQNSKKWQVMVTSEQNPVKLRNVGSELVSRIFTVKGIVVSTSKPFFKASVLKIQCRCCNHIKDIRLSPGQYPYVPRKCLQSPNSKPCERDSYIVLPTSLVDDAQNIKIQEFPEQIPTGQTPKTFSLFVDRYNVEKCIPGDKVKITGIMMVQKVVNNCDNAAAGYIYVTGIEKVTQRNMTYYSKEEESVFKKMAKDPDVYQKIVESIAPAIYGYEEIKKAIACQLFGGSRKVLSDGTKLRGDINLLLIGDPSTAKSQFLKFVQQTASVAIFTSGRGSSAAGLTATVNRDLASGEFQIQGGALVLADGGIVCIDEFDKMRVCDRVAIHQAMQQQTISIAKAGITTRLNSRTSVLAAANPIFGLWKSTEDIAEQVQLQTTILSRFDCVFIVKDVNTAEYNKKMVGHILDLHTGKPTVNTTIRGNIPYDVLKRYISYARSKCGPKLTYEAAEKVTELYISDRKKSKQFVADFKGKNSMPVTVRQLEAVIRLSQALAKMRLVSEVTVEFVDEAHKLFELSTLKSMEAREVGIEISGNLAGDIVKVEEAIKKRVSIGSQVSVSKILEEMDHKYSSVLLQHAIYGLTRNGDFREMKGRKMLVREK